jgi:hypothetical protein
MVGARRTPRPWLALKKPSFASLPSVKKSSVSFPSGLCVLCDLLC